MKKQIFKIMVLAVLAAVTFSSCKSVSVLNVRVVYKKDLKDTTYVDTVRHTFERIVNYERILMPTPTKSTIKDIAYLYDNETLKASVILENGHVITLSTMQLSALKSDLLIGKDMVYYDEYNKRLDSIPHYSYKLTIEEKNNNNTFDTVSIDTIESNIEERIISIPFLTVYQIDNILENWADTTKHIFYSTKTIQDEIEFIDYNRSRANIACLDKRIKRIGGDKVYQLKMYQKRKNGTWIHAWVNTDEDVYNSIIFPSDFCLYDKDWKCKIVKTFPVKYINKIYSTEETLLSITSRVE